MIRLEDRAAEVYREADIFSDDELSEEESDDNSDDKKISHNQECELPRHFLGGTINRNNATPSVDNAHDATVSDCQHNVNNSDCPPSPWGSSSSKQRVIDKFNDEGSYIHLLVEQCTPNECSNVKFEQIRQKYAGSKNYKTSLFRANMKCLLNHHLKRTGPFKATNVEPWHTSSSKHLSRAYSLLFLFYMNQNESGKISGMTAEEIWDSHPQFQLYDLTINSRHITKL